MNKRRIDVMEHLTPIMKGVQKGALITVKSQNKVNPMTISWGQIGIEWNKLIFTTFVRTSRFTHILLEESGEFTLNVGDASKIAKIIKLCGTKSGAEHDKVKELGLTLVDSDEVNAPGILELPLTLECKVIYTQSQDPNSIPEHLNSQFYDKHGVQGDYHTMFYGEIVNAYTIEQ